MSDLTVSHEPNSQESDEIEYFSGKVLNLTEAMPDIDFKGIVNQICQFVDIASVLSRIKKGTEYIVQIPAEFQSGLTSGKYKIMESSKTGKLWANLMEIGEDGRSKIVTPLDIKKRQFVQENPVKDITSNFHNLYMQQQMIKIAHLVESTLLVVQRIEHGQMDDRIGLLNAGSQGILLALAQKDEPSRAIALTHARGNINVAQNQIFEAFKRRVEAFEPLPKQKLFQFFRELVSHGSYLNAHDNEYDAIQEYYHLFLQATAMLASSYAIVGDIEAAQRVFDMGVEKLSIIDNSNLKTIEYTHPKSDFFKIYESSSARLLEEKAICLETAREYDCLSITVSGEYLLEAIENEDGTSRQETE